MKKYALLALLLLAAGPTRAALPANILDHLSSPDLGKRYKADMALRALVSEACRPGADAAQRAALEKDLLDLAADDRQPETTRIAALVQMPYFGTAAAVPVLAGLLEDSRPAIREYARRGLRNNPDPGASEPLRRALEKASDPTWELGLMQALRHRGDTDSVPLLTARLASSNDAVAGLAAEALGEFGPETSVSPRACARPRRAR
jgi:HEAT repeat protein